MNFKDFLSENKEKHSVLTFGRMNPPTAGHEKLVNKTKQVAKSVNGSHHIVISHTQDKKKNPLSPKQKLTHAKRFFPNSNITTSTKEHPNFLSQAEKLHKSGTTHLHMVAGSDRVQEFHKVLHKYNGTHKGALFNFKKIKVHSAGHRDPDSEGTSGMSASKMRGHASKGNYSSFKKGLPSHVNDNHAKELYNHVRSGMQIKEDYKAIFIIGGPGSGKDLILNNINKTYDLQEISLEKADKFLHENYSNPKNTSEFSQRYAIKERNGLIINGSADDFELVEKVKKTLHEMSYDTMMVNVITSNEASIQRNKERGERGGRMLSEEVRYEKWKRVNALREHYKGFFNDYVEFDNSQKLDKNIPIELLDLIKEEFEKSNSAIEEFMIRQAVTNQIDEITDDINQEFEDTFSEDLRNWFDKSHPDGGWKRIDSKGNVKGDCAREPGEPKPKCMSNKKISQLSKKERAAAVRAKRKHDPVADRAGKGGKPVNVSNFGKGKISENIMEKDNEAIVKENKNISVKSFAEVSTITRFDRNGDDGGRNSSLAVSNSKQQTESYKDGEERRSGDISRQQETQEKASKKTFSEIFKKQKSVYESIDRGTEVGLSMASSGENLSRPNTMSNKPKKKSLKELIGDTSLKSIAVPKAETQRKLGVEKPGDLKTKKYIT